MRYRRSHVPGALVFLTLVTQARRPLLCLPEVRAAFREAVTTVSARHPFRTVAYVVLPDHCHLLWRLPEDDGDFSRRVRLIKHRMARCPDMPKPLWQARFWDHLIRDETDLRKHMDYIHFNPVKHGHARRAVDWLDSSFHHHVARGWYSENWGVEGDLEVGGE